MSDSRGGSAAAHAENFLSSLKDERDRDRDRRSSHRDDRDSHRDRDRDRGGRDREDRHRRDDRDSHRDRDRDRDRAREGRDPHSRRDDDRRRYDDDRRRYDDDRRREHRGGRDEGNFRSRNEWGGGRGGGDDFRGRGDGGPRGRGRERGGTPERRSPTPPGAVPLSQRKRKASGWDVHAPGYEQYTALQAKQTGLFNLPGANRTHVPPILGIQGLPPPMPLQSFAAMGLAGNNPNLARQSRRLYLGSIPPEANEENIGAFFNAKMIEMGIGTSGPGDPVLAVQVNREKNYAFVEFRSAEDATSAMAFDGIFFLNGPLRIRRPKDYLGPDSAAYTGAPHVPGVVSTNVPDSINKIFVGGLPTYLDEEQVMELLKSFGELKAFNLVRENGTGVSKGFAFFEYVDPAVTDVATQGLNGMELGDRFLVVQRASIGAKPGMPGLPFDEFPPEAPRPIMAAGESGEGAPARILLMLNMVVADDLADDTEYSEIFDDIRDECSIFGKIIDLRVPRPVKKDKSKWAPGEGGAQAAVTAQMVDEAAGVGRVYVKYETAEGANAALQSLAGRSFAGRSILATLLTDDSKTTPPLELIFAGPPTI